MWYAHVLPGRLYVARPHPPRQPGAVALSDGGSMWSAHVLPGVVCGPPTSPLSSSTDIGVEGLLEDWGLHVVRPRPPSSAMKEPGVVAHPEPARGLFRQTGLALVKKRVP